MTSGRWLDRSIGTPSSACSGLPFSTGKVYSNSKYSVAVDGNELHFYRRTRTTLCTAFFEKAPGSNHTKSLLAKWENRFFVLTPDALLYYTDASRSTLKGEFDITRSRLVSPPKNADKEIHIRVDARDPNSRVFKMRSNDAQCVAEWKAKLESVINA
jgi:hypothetical protein